MGQLSRRWRSDGLGSFGGGRRPVQDLVRAALFCWFWAAKSRLSGTGGQLFLSYFAA